MRFNVVLRYMGLVLLLDAVFMLISAGISLLNNFDTGFYPLLLSFILTAVLGAFPLIFVEGGEQINNKEGYAIVVGAWIPPAVEPAQPHCRLKKIRTAIANGVHNVESAVANPVVEVTAISWKEP